MTPSGREKQAAKEECLKQLKVDIIEGRTPSDAHASLGVV
jgi:hypothetical protein